MALTQISTAGVKDDAVTAGKIPANAVGSSELADNAVDTAAIAANAVTTAKIANQAITSDLIQNGGIVAGDLATNSVTTAKIADDAVTNAKVADDAIGVAQLSASGTASSSTFLRGDNSWTAVNTDLVSDTSPQLGGDLASNGNDIDFADNDKAIFGTSGDGLEIYHGSNQSWIQDTGTGNLVIDTNGTQVSITSGGGAKTQARFIKDGAVKLSYDDGIKLETTNTGATVTGNLTTTKLLSSQSSGSAGLGFADNVQIHLGTSDDLKIYHDGSNSYLQHGTVGNLRYQSGNHDFYNQAGNEFMCRMFQDAGVELYYNSSKTFETLSGGNKFHGYLFGTDDAKIYLGASNDLQIYHDGTNSLIRDTGNGYLKIDSNGSGIYLNKSDGESMASFITDGAVELYYNGSKKLETYNNGVLMGSITHTLLWPNVSNSNSRSFGFIGEDGSYGKFELKCSNGQDTTLDETCIRAYANGGIILYHDDMGRFETASHGVTIKQPGDRLQWTASSGSPPQFYNDGSSARDLKLNIDNDHHYTFHQNGIFYQQGANSSNGGAYSSPKASYPVRAFLNFDDEDNVVHSSGNVSSVNDTGTGYFTINWATNFPDTHYACVGTSGGAGGSRGDDSVVTYANTDHSVGSINVRTRKFTDNNMTNSENTGFVAVR